MRACRIDARRDVMAETRCDISKSMSTVVCVVARVFQSRCEIQIVRGASSQYDNENNVFGIVQMICCSRHSPVMQRAREDAKANSCRQVDFCAACSQCTFVICFMRAPSCQPYRPRCGVRKQLASACHCCQSARDEKRRKELTRNMKSRSATENFQLVMRVVVIR